MSGASNRLLEIGDVTSPPPQTASGGTLFDHYPANDNDRTDPARPQPGITGPAAFHQVGQQLIEEAVRDARRAASAVDVFRSAIELFPSDPWLHNGLGRALVELAQAGSGGASSEILPEAIREFQKARNGTKVGSAAHLRFQINLFTTRWQQAELSGDRDQLQKAFEALRSLPGLSEESPYWPHVQDYIGNAHMALGEPDKAIPAYEAAIKGWRVAGNQAEEARSHNNLGTAYAALQRRDEAGDQYQSALTLLSADRTSLLWARTNENLGRLCLEKLQAEASPQKIDQLIRTAAKSFEESRTVTEQRSRAEWSASTLNLAITQIWRGRYLARHRDNRTAGIAAIRESLDLYKQAAPRLPAALINGLVSNLSTTCQILAGLSPIEETINYIGSYKHDILLFGVDEEFQEKLTRALNPVIKGLAEKLRINPGNGTDVDENDHIIRDILSILRGTDTEEWPAIFAAVQARAGKAPSPRQAQTAEAQSAARATTYRPKGDRTLPALPAGLTWPTETYSGSDEAKRGGGGIVAYLERVWLPLLQAGIADRRALESLDPSAIKAIKNYSSSRPTTGHRKIWPEHLHFSTLKEVNDRLVQTHSDAARVAANRRKHRHPALKP